MRLKKIIIALMTALTFYGTMNVAASTEIAEAKTTQVYKSHLSKANQKAKNWIAYHESRGSYHARNGRYIGRYQLSASYLHGNYSKANQEKTADHYVNSRYGSWVNAKHHWKVYGWY